MLKKLIALIAAGMFSASMLTMPVSAEEKMTETVTYQYGDASFTREMERLGRGLIAVKSNSGVYLSWRLLGSESTAANVNSSPQFNVYRDGEKIAVVSNSTNYFDSNPGSSYSVAPVKRGVEGERCAEASVNADSYFDVPLSKPQAFVTSAGTSIEYTAGDVSCGDLDGDGEYELVLKWDANPQDSGDGWSLSGNVLIDAYETDGTHLWRIDLGSNIRCGEHYTQFLVYDFDGDGMAEVTAKTAPGSTDGNGDYVTAASLDSSIRNADNSAVYADSSSGRVLKGPEYFTIFNGLSGAAVDTISYPIDRVDVTAWGDDFGNRSERYLADVAYLDGEKPYMVYWRGYYDGKNSYPGRTGIFGASFDGERLNVEYIFDTRAGQPGYTSGNESYIGQGNHNITAADVDGDGKDEFISGSLCMEVDENGKLVPKWCYGAGHGDALHIGDYDPTHDGMEYFTVHEASPYGMTVLDAADGTVIKHVDGLKDTGRGIMANIGVKGYYQIWGTAGAGVGWHAALGSGEFENLGQTYSTLPSMNFRIFWDGDLYDELLDGTSITSWNGSGMKSIFTADGCVSVNSTKAVPALQADLFGDWREEVVYPLSDSSALRVFTTTALTSYKLPTLMHDPVYRSGVAAEQTAYNQPPHIGYYLSEDIFNASPEAEEIILSKENAVIALGRKIMLTAEVYPSDAVSKTVEWSTSDESIARPENGYIRGVGTGSAVITASIGECKASCIVTVTDPGVYEQVPSVIEITAPETVYVPDCDSTQLDGISAAVYDQYGFEIRNAEVGWSCSAESGWNILGGAVMSVDKDLEPGEITLRAEYGGVSAAKTIAVKSFADYFYIDEDFTDAPELSQGETNVSAAVGDITYSIDARQNGADGKTSFSGGYRDNDKYLVLRDGRFSNSSRNPRMTLNTAPTQYDDSMDYVLNFELCFPESKYSDATDTRTITLSNNGTTVKSIQSTSFEKDTWFRYMLVRHKGEWYEALFSNDGTPISFGKADINSSAVINRIDVTSKLGSAGTNDYSIDTYMDSLKYYMTDSAISDITVSVLDEYGSPYAGAAVDIGAFSAVTDENGGAEFTLPNGYYKGYITGGTVSNAAINLTVSGNSSEYVYTMPITPSVTVDEGEIYVHSPEVSQVYCAKYNEDRTLAQIAAYDADGDIIFFPGFIPDKVFMWRNMTPYE